MKQPEIAIGSESDQSTYLITNILNSIVFGNFEFDWLTLYQSQHLHLYLLWTILQSLNLAIIIAVMKQIPS